MSPPAEHGDVTVVIPCFNHGAYIAEAVESVLAQDGPTPRIVVVDDGSTDEATKRAFDALPDGVEVIHQANAGPAAARNAGIESTDSPYLLMLDADDRLPEGRAGRPASGARRRSRGRLRLRRDALLRRLVG